MAKRRPSSSSSKDPSSSTTTSANKRPKPQSHPPPPPPIHSAPPPSPPISPLSTTTNHQQQPPAALPLILSRIASATALSLAFLSRHDLDIHPSQSLSLHSHLISCLRSLSSLHSLLPFPSPSLPPSPSSSGYWYLRFLAAAPSDSDPRWLETFRMSRPSFYLLLQILTPSLYGDSPLPPPDHKLAAALFRLAHKASHASVAHRFGLDGAQAACRTFYEVCRAACDRLGYLLGMPKEGISGTAILPGCHGAVGYSRFPVGEGGVSSVVVQAVVDRDGRFLDVSAGWAGAMSPAEILPRTKLFASYLEETEIGHDPSPEIGKSCDLDAVLARGYLLGGSCCPLLPWLLTPFEDRKTPGVHAFEEVHLQAMKVVAKAFWELRARWRLLGENWKEECMEALPFVIVMCCLLHNFLIRCREPLLDDDMDVPAVLDVFAKFEGKVGGEGRRVREALASQLMTMARR